MTETSGPSPRGGSRTESVTTTVCAMADTTAIVSVVAASFVSVVSIVTSAVNSRADRKQARALAARAEAAAERAALREALKDLALWVVTARSFLRYPRAREFEALYRTRALDALLLRYAPARLAKALKDFDDAVAADGEAVRRAYLEAMDAVEAKEAALDAMDFGRAAEERARERQIIDPVRTELQRLREALQTLESTLSSVLTSASDSVDDPTDKTA